MRSVPHSYRLGLGLSCALFFTDLSSISRGQSAPPQATMEEQNPLLLSSITVVGSKENLERLPGSGAYLARGDIRTFAFDDINQVIRHTPGVYIRQEDGYGLFPNVSLRGVSTTRNSKITVMEDGILMAPASYSDPAAYYTPNVGRMSGLEILKGSSQIKYGPETTGGVINYLSSPIPSRASGSLSATYGSDADRRLQASYGNRIATSWGGVGFLVENTYRKTNGFKAIAPAVGGGFAGGNRTGFERNEPLAKLRLEFTNSVQQSLELHYGRTDLDADETYLGLTEDDFRADPTQRYAASRFDHIATEHERLSARYAIRPFDAVKLTLTAYRTDFARNWYKLDAAGAGLSGAFVNPSEALAGQFGPGIIQVLKGQGEGRLRVRANNRTYGAEGVELNTVGDFAVARSAHRIEFGVRRHEDFADRFQWDDVYTQTSDGSASRTTAGIPGTQENRRAEATAVAWFIQDQVTLGALTVTPGIRYESIDYADIRRSTAPGATFNQVTSVGRKSINTVAPGIGATWVQSERVTWLAGIHRGVSPPGPASAGNSLTEENSLGFEAGVRFHNRRDLSVELVAFHTHFEDLIVEQNAGGGGGVGQTSNIGEVSTQGLEVTASYDPSIVQGWSVRNPWTLGLTLTRAVLGNDVNAAGNGGNIAESIFSGGRKGNRLPYIPEYQLSFGTRFEKGAWSLHFDAYYQPATYASANNSSAQLNPDASPAGGLQPALDSRYGKVDAFFLLDTALHYRFSDRVRLKLAATNLLDRDYIASRVPIGPRPGAPRMLTGGVDLLF